MPSTHRKLQRKDLKEPDFFIAFMRDLREFLVTRTREILFSVAIVGGIGLLVLVIYYYDRTRDAEVSEKFYQAFAALQDKHYKTAQDGFMKLAAGEPTRRLGRLARLYLASTYLAQDDPQHARDALIAYLADARDPAFEGNALIQLGVVYEQLGDYQKAAGSYRQAASIQGPESLTAELGGARMLQRQGDRAGAIAAYRGFLEHHPFTPQRPDVVEALAQLGAAPAAPRPPILPMKAPPTPNIRP
jgi:predicted negative regulator of RcsB-dependent stress response